MSKPEKYIWPHDQLRMVDISLHEFLLMLKNLQLISAESFYNGISCSTDLLCREEEEE